MDLQTRKRKFIKEFLEIESEETLERLEVLLKKEKEISERKLDLMSKEELNSRIERSEIDFKNNRFKTSSDLLTKYQ
ncbi:hypothetical protein ACWBC2_16950 [Salegentibacter agarivorans]|jgi:chemotaxis protein CheY-P-specific phosphatase CheC|uniref:hypothetical protein n=1 Tax=Salegentibacter sp. BDJ18 TaxID=2816376 RepID=UPI001AAFFB50|nr:hypothetical protein [Salegentibacter sp. BDJ18]MBO2545836.1 hypothetical protein [Salegentibacter sp. BDJ18]|tara:strand:+ start:904 stop:1134 length:231 start_codon:yes stop_codon:yes gene_type:complete